MRLYVIGPVSGHEGDNREAFEEARKRLRAAGYEVEIPHDWIRSGTPWQEAMRASVAQMLSMDNRRLPVYDGVAELPGVFGSKGARCERGICEQLGIPHKTVDEWCAEKPENPVERARTCGSCAHFAKRHGGYRDNDGVCLMVGVTVSSEKPVDGVNPCGRGRKFEARA